MKLREKTMIGSNCRLDGVDRMYEASGYEAGQSAGKSRRSEIDISSRIRRTHVILFWSEHTLTVLYASSKHS